MKKEKGKGKTLGRSFPYTFEAEMKGPIKEVKYLILLIFWMKHSQQWRPFGNIGHQLTF
jgi:hypothetical protein